MARLPIPGADRGTWGEILNEFLSVSHETDGTLKSSAVVKTSGDQTIAGVKTFSSSPIVPTPTGATDAANKQYVDDTASAGAPDADGSTKGLVQLAGDLSGTAASPQIAAGAIVDADVNAAAAIAQSKIANLTTDLAGKASTTHSHTASDVTDFDTEVSANTDVAGNTAARHTHSNSSVLDATTASFTTADETKLDAIEAGADVTDAANVAAAGAVMNSGDQTVAGIKTFSSDPVIPDEAYDATNWDGVLEPPTKNAVRDKFENLDVITTGVRTSPDTSTPGQIGIDVTLDSGIAGGDTLTGGTLAGDDLTLASTTNATRGTIFMRDQVELLSEDKTVSGSTAVGGIAATKLDSTLTLSSTYQDGLTAFANNTVLIGDISPTIAFSETGSLYGSFYGYFFHPTIKNVTAQAENIFGNTAVIFSPSYDADGATFSAQHAGFIDSATVGSDDSTMTLTTNSSFSSGLTVNAGGAVTTRQAIIINDATGSGTLTTQVAIEIGSLTKGTTNVGIRNASTEVATPSVATITAAGNTITANAKVKRLNNTSGGSVTLTSTPTIADGLDGQILILFNSSGNSVVLQDQGSLAGSNLRLSAASITLGQRDSIQLLFSSTLGDWIQISQVNVL